VVFPKQKRFAAKRFCFGKKHPLLGRRHLVNAYEMNVGWLIPFVDKRVGGK